MPTVDIQPSLRNTQAVGAALLHQFARERFLQAGLDENLIRQAEAIEHVDFLATSLLQGEDCEIADCIAEEHVKTSRDHNSENNNDSNSNGDSSPTDSISIRNNLSWSDISNASSSPDDDLTIIQDNPSYQFHSIAESPNVTTSNDDTVYHSIDRGRTVLTTNLDRLQSTPLAVRYSRELKKIAEEFEKTRERHFIRQEAEKVALGSITEEAFTQLLEELFQGGITREKIVVIFLFSTDVALRAASFAQGMVVKLLAWTFSFIINTVCRLVHELGGWEKLLFYQLPSLLISCCAILGIFVLGFHLNKSLRWTSP